MRLFRKPIVVVAILALTGGFVSWWRNWRPVSGAFYTVAVDQYRAGEFEGSLENLKKAYRLNPLDTAILRQIGWSHLRLGNYDEAHRYFLRALRFNPQLDEARLGLGYALLEKGEFARALALFDRLPEEMRESSDVQGARARIARLQGRNRDALAAVESMLRKNPQDALALQELAYLTGAESLQALEAHRSGPAERPALRTLRARIRDGFFEIPAADGWKRIYIAGVNIGPAIPGRFASEPPVEMSVYLEWLNLIREMGANTVRVYTLLPPAFYRALAEHNAVHAATPLYLFQEIWLEDPPLDNLLDPAFTAGFEKEIRRVIDALHGQADIPFERAHAAGIYEVDVSPYVLAWVVGREIEPRVVVTTNLRNPRVATYEGRYLKVEEGNPTEAWLARMCDGAVAYEIEAYNQERPVAFVNWPPLDPLTHPTESRLVDELRFRAARGEKLAPLGLGVRDDLDVVSVDEEKVSPQPGFEAGYFGFLHVYPFWPDFMFLEPQFLEARDHFGPSAYWGYLQALKRHYRRTPLLIGEYGMSTSLGIAHFHPHGMHHGGMSEQHQGELIVRLTQNIRDAGFAGSLLFEWIDEWWKHNWIADEWEKPFHRKPFWHNELNPEQSFGIAKFLTREPLHYTPLEMPPSASPGATHPPRIRGVEWARDAAAFYVDLVLELPQGAEPDWSRDRYLIAINTCGAPCGSGALPYTNVRVEPGANFLVHVAGPGATRLLIARSYNPFRPSPVEGTGMVDLAISPNASLTFEPEGVFEEMLIETNRRRVTRDGRLIEPIRYSRSPLNYGVFDPNIPSAYDSRAQWYFDSASRRLRFRLSWALLLTLDPSQGFIYAGTNARAETFGRTSNRIELSVIAYSEGGDTTQVVAGEAAGGVIARGLELPWPRWNELRYRLKTKQSYPIVSEALGRLTGYGASAGGP